MGLKSFFSEAFAVTDDKHGGKAGDARADVHDITTGIIKYT